MLTKVFAENEYSKIQCQQHEIYSPTKNLCREGKEYGKHYHDDNECFSTYCNEGIQRCDCKDIYQCFGCTQDDSICLRVEQTRPSVNLEICDIYVVAKEYHTKENKSIKRSLTYTGSKQIKKSKKTFVFSKGSAHQVAYEPLSGKSKKSNKIHSLHSLAPTTIKKPSKKKKKQVIFTFPKVGANLKQSCILMRNQFW